MQWYISENFQLSIKMKKNPKITKLFEIEDPDERKQAASAILLDLQKKGDALGEPPVSVEIEKTLYSASCTVILVCSIIGTIFLAGSSFYFQSLPRPFSYLTTQEGQLYEIKPYKIVR